MASLGEMLSNINFCKPKKPINNVNGPLVFLYKSGLPAYTTDTFTALGPFFPSSTS